MVFSTISNENFTYIYTYCFFLTYRRSHSSIHFVALLSFSIFTFFFRYSAKVYLSLTIICFLRIFFVPFRALTIYRFSLFILFPRIVYVALTSFPPCLFYMARVIVHVYTRVDHSRPAFYTPSFTSLTPRIPLPDSPTHNSLLFLSYTDIYERRDPFACLRIATDSKYFRSIYYSDHF